MRGRPIAGNDYVFFQGPKPLTGNQPDLPSFFSAENFADLEFTPTQIAVTVVGPATAAVLAAGLVANGDLVLPF